MRRAILLACLFALPGVAQGQVGPEYGPSGELFYRAPVSIYPSHNAYYGYHDGIVQGTPRATTTGNVWSNNSWNVRPNWRQTGQYRHHARYSYLPQYPGLIGSNRPNARPDVYVVPPPTVTPYHDPYFEERIWDDDDYNYLGW